MRNPEPIPFFRTLTVLSETDRQAIFQAVLRVLEQAIASAPDNIPLFNREGDLAMDVGERRAYFGTGSDLTAHVDGETLARRPTTLESVARAARVCDALPNIDFIMSFAIPHEIDPRRAFVESFAAMAANSAKPIVNIADDRTDLSVIWEMSKAIRGGEKHLREKSLDGKIRDELVRLRREGGRAILARLEN